MDEKLAERERHLHQQLAELRMSYQKAAEPIIAELVRIESMKPPKPIIITRRLDGTCVPVDVDQK